MSDPAYYRAEAQRMLDWADTSPHPIVANRWRRLAQDYWSLAEQIETRGLGRPSILTAPMQQQPVQQQQTKSTTGDK